MSCSHLTDVTTATLRGHLSNMNVIKRLPVIFDMMTSSSGINGWVNDGGAGDLRRHRAHYDIIIMANWLYNLNNTTHNKTVCIFYGIWFKCLLICSYCVLHNLWHNCAFHEPFLTFFQIRWDCCNSISDHYIVTRFCIKFQSFAAIMGDKINDSTGHSCILDGQYSYYSMTKYDYRATSNCSVCDECY